MELTYYSAGKYYFYVILRKQMTVEEQMNNKKTKNLTLLALFIAIEVVMVMVPFLGFIPIGPLRATLLHVPVIIAAIVLGTKQGCFVGLVFGLSSLLMNTFQPTITSFVFSPFISGSVLSAIIAIVPRVMIGFVSGSIYQLLKNKKQIIAIALSAFLGALTNTVLVLGGIWALFGSSYAKAIGQDVRTLGNYFLAVSGTQSLLEACVGVVLVLVISKPLLALMKRG